MLEQINIYGRNMVEQSIYRLRLFEPPEGYFLAFSGGKDSVTIKALADLAGVKYEAHYQVTSVDPPELVQFIKTFKDVTLDIPRYKDGAAVTMWNLIPKKRLPPTRIVRYCCEYLKEGAGEDRFRVTGVRWEESTRRRNTRAGLEYADTKTARRELHDPDSVAPGDVKEIQAKASRILNPVIDWSDADIWQFIHDQGLRYCRLYDEGYTRLGCIGCPMAGAYQVKEFDRWPKYKEAYIRAFQEMLDRRNADLLKKGAVVREWKNGEDVYNWWINKTAGND